MADVFICYRRDDAGGHAGRLFDRLRTEFGASRVFMDVTGTELGRNYKKHIEQTIGDSIVVVALVGQVWATVVDRQGRRRLEDPRDPVRLELAAALAAEKLVIPVLVEGTRMPAAEELPPELEEFPDLMAAELSNTSWDYDVGVLVAAIKGHVKVEEGAEPFPDVAPGAPEARPYGVGRDAREALAAGVRAVADAVGPTLGPNGQFVVVVTGDRRRRTRSGSLIARTLRSTGPLEEQGAELVRDMAMVLEDAIGDGVTAAILMAAALASGCLKAERGGGNRARIARGLRNAVDRAVAQIEADAVYLRAKEQVARVAAAAADDEEIGMLIADAIDKVGQDGVLMIEEGQTFGLDLEFTEGMRFDSGYISPYMVTDEERTEAVLEDPYILIANQKISSVRDILPVLEQVIQAGRPILIIAEDVDGEALATLVVNKLRGTFTGVAVKAPRFGDQRARVLEDLAILTGGDMISEEMGVKLENTQISQLGRTRRVVVTKGATTIIDGAGDSEAIKGRINQIKAAIDNAGSDAERERLQQRLAKLAGGVAIVKVGAATETEMKEKKHLVERAAKAGWGAARDGLVPGAATALVAAGRAIDIAAYPAGDERAGAQVVLDALETPLRQLAANGGFDAQQLLDELRRLGTSHTFDLTTGNTIDVGRDEAPIDPATAPLLGLLQAASLAEHVLTTEGIIAGDAPPKPAEQPPDQARLQPQPAEEGEGD